MLSSSRRKLLATATERYAQSLTGEAMAYLNGRGIPEDVAQRFQLGVVVDPVKGHANYQGWISIPYLTPNGPVAMKFRRLDDEPPKYLGPANQRVHLYNVGAIHAKPHTMIVVEGELDAVIMDGVVGLPAVGVAGVDNWAPHFPRVLEGFDRILILTDNDLKDDGRNPGKELQSRLLRELPQSVPVDLPPGEDVNSYTITHGVSAVRDLVGL